MSAERTSPETRLRPCASLGVAIGTERVVVVCRDPFGRTGSMLYSALDGGPEPDGSWQALEEALAGLCDRLGVERATADVALLPPLAVAKSVAIPPVAPAQVDALLARNFRRYFLAPYVSPIVRARPTSMESRKATRAFAACAEASVAASVCRAAQKAGLEVVSLTAGPVALADGIAARRSLGTGRTTVTWNAGAWRGGMVLADGVVERVESWPEGSDADFAERAARLASETAADDSIRLGATTDPDGSAEILAATGAAVRGHVAPSLLPDSRIDSLRVTARGRAVRLAVGAAAAVVIGIAAHWFGLHRELSALEAGRAAFAEEITEALELRSAANKVQDRLAGILEAEEGTTHWTPTLAALAEVLPSSTYLVSLNTEGVSLTMDGVTTDSESIVGQLEASPYFANVTLTGVRSADPSRAMAGSQFDLAMMLRTGGEEPPPAPGNDR